MLRSSTHLFDLLQSPPIDASLPTASELGKTTQWSPHKKFQPGKINRIWITKPSENIAEVKSSEPPKTSHSESALPFAYERKLSQSDKSKLIRLLNVLPGRSIDPITCELQYVLLDNPPRYQALSYCWGELTSYQTIWCDGKALDVTQNLAAAIKSIRQEDTSTLVWADAICIHQASVEEKNYQVPLMRQIYAKAANVQVWLGIDTSTGAYRESFELLKLLCRAYHVLGWDFDVMARHDPSKSKLIESCGLPATDDSCWDSLTELTQNQWFTRTWIVQEIVVSQNAIVRCGDATISWKQFYVGFIFAFKAGYLIYRPDVIWLSTAYQRIISLLSAQNRFVKTPGDGLDLLSLLECYRSAQATDPRDKVYGLLGLAPKVGNSQHEIMPDYSLEASVVYIDIAKAIVMKCDYLDILGIPVAPFNPEIGELPSWVPDWSLTRETSSLGLVNEDGTYTFTFNATNDAKAQRVNFDGHILIIEGHVIDSVAQLSDTMDLICRIQSKNPQKSKLALSQAGVVWTMFRVLIILGNWLLMCKMSHLVYEREQITSVFYRTLLYDDFSHGYTIDAIEADYSNWVIRTLLFVYRKLLQASEFCIRHGLYVRKLSAHMRGTRDFKENFPYVDIIARTIGRRMAITANGYIGLFPATTELEDRIVLVEGARVPLVMRKVNDAEWRLIGDCYIHGAMQGELFERSRCTEMRII